MAKQSSASPDKDMVDRPDLEAHVFCRVLDDVGEVATDDNACVHCPAISPLHTEALFPSHGHQELHEYIFGSELTSPTQ